MHVETPSVAGGNDRRSDFRRNMLLVTALFVSMMASIDMTIVTVALPYMAGNLGATPDEITWVVTMFAVGQAIVIGITGHLSRLLGRRRLAIVSVVGFVAVSLLCGIAASLEQMVVLRLIQGAFCAPLVPLSLSMLIDAFPPERRARVLSLWSMGIMGGPAIGPALGGYLAENLDWRWNFWVNLPVGIIALSMVLRFVDRVEPRPVRTDWLGLVLMASFLIGLQITLDQGDRLDWWGSLEIQLLSVLTVASFVAFIGRGLVLGEHNIVNLRLFTDINFAACTVLVTVLGSIFLALLVIGPQLFIDVFDWEVTTAGYVIGAFGTAGLFGALLSSRLVVFLGIRNMVLLALALSTAGWYQFSRISLDASPFEAALPGMTVEFGLMLVFPLVSAQAFSRLPAAARDEAAGLFNLTKTLGFSLGTTLVATLVYRGSQTNWNVYGGLLSPLNPGYEHFLQTAGLADDLPLAAAYFGALLETNSQMVTLVQTMELFALLSLSAMPLVLLLNRGSEGRRGARRQIRVASGS